MTKFTDPIQNFIRLVDDYLAKNDNFLVMYRQLMQSPSENPGVTDTLSIALPNLSRELKAVRQRVVASGSKMALDIASVGGDAKGLLRFMGEIEHPRRVDSLNAEVVMGPAYDLWGAIKAELQMFAFQGAPKAKVNGVDLSRLAMLDDVGLEIVNIVGNNKKNKNESKMGDKKNDQNTTIPYDPEILKRVHDIDIAARRQAQNDAMTPAQRRVKKAFEDKLKRAEAALGIREEDAGDKRKPTNLENRNVGHSDDFRSLKWLDEAYSFTANQAPVVKILYGHWKNGTSDVGSETLLSAVDHELPPERLSVVFRGNPAWGTIIVPGKTKGSYKLEPPTKKCDAH